MLQYYTNAYFKGVNELLRKYRNETMVNEYKVRLAAGVKKCKKLAALALMKFKIPRQSPEIHEHKYKPSLLNVRFKTPLVVCITVVRSFQTDLHFGRNEEKECFVY